jgi:hypothetical protein
MAKRPAKKPDKQLDLPPAPPASSAATTRRVLPMQLHIGDRLADETGEWEVVGRPFTTAGGKNAHVRLQRVNQPGGTDIRSWGAHEKVSVKRTTAEEDKR